MDRLDVELDFLNQALLIIGFLVAMPDGFQKGVPDTNNSGAFEGGKLPGMTFFHEPVNLALECAPFLSERFPLRDVWNLIEQGAARKGRLVDCLHQVVCIYLIQHQASSLWKSGL